MHPRAHVDAGFLGADQASGALGVGKGCGEQLLAIGVRT